MRVCDKCGGENADLLTNADSWCTHCGEFLGFPLATRQRGPQIRLLLVDQQVSVRPGGEAVLLAHVHNRGEIVEQVTLTVEGAAAAWAHPEPAEVGLFPNQKSEIRLVFRPPRSAAVRAGAAPFRLLATSQSDAQISDRADGTMDLGAFFDVRASLVPRHSSGLSGAAHRLVIDNAGNADVDLPVAVSDPDQALSFEVDPPSVHIAPAATAEVRIGVRPRATLDGSQDRTYPFEVSLQPPEQAAIVLQAVHVQEAPATAPSLVLADAHLHARPGQEISTAVTLRSRGGGGESYALELLGPAAAWGRVVPPTIFVPPGGEATVNIVFLPPAAPPAPASELPFGLRVRSQVDASRTAVTEGRLTVDAVTEITFEVAPRQARGRWSGRYVIEVENRGNLLAPLRPVALDGDHDLSFAVSPRQLDVPAGGQALVLCRARTRRPRLLAKAVRRPFQIDVVPVAGDGRATSRREGTGTDMVFEQRPVLPRRLALVMAILVVIGGAGVAALAILSGSGSFTI